MIFLGVESILATLGLKCPWELNLYQGDVFTHLDNSFCFQNCFPQPRIVYPTMYAFVVWYELNQEWKWGLTRLINLVCEGTSQTNLGGWFSSLHTLNSTGREGIARGTMQQRRGCFLMLGGQMFRSQEIFGAGVHSSVEELTSLVVSLSISFAA